MEQQNKQRIVTTLICASLLFAVALGCKRFVKRNRGNSPFSRSDSQKDTPTDGLTEKTNLYIKQCVNQYSNRVMDSYRRYASWLKDVDKGPTGKEDNVYTLYNINGDGHDCVDAIKKAKGMEPEMSEAEAAADKYATALIEAIKQINAIYPYYNHDDYKDDGFQKGKTAHPALLQAFRNFEQANKSFDVEVDKLEDAVANKRLDELKDDSSKRYEYLVVDTGIKSKKILRAVKGTEFSQLKAEDLQPLIDSFEKSVDDLKASEKRTSGSLYLSSCDDFLKAAKELMRRVRDKQPFSDFEKRELGTPGGWMVDGSPDKLINKYNEMISRRGMRI